MVTIFLKALSDEDDEVQNNAAFGCGAICESLGAPSSKYFMQMLQKLRPLFSHEKTPSLLDNCCAAVSKMILANPASVPLDQVLPVLFEFLPIRTDFTENEAVFRCIFYLFSTNNPYVIFIILYSHPSFLLVINFLIN